MKKAISLLLSAVLLLGISVSALAATTSISSNKTTLKKDESLDVYLTLSEALENITNFEFSLYFDAEYFELQSSEKGPACDKAQISKLKTDKNEKPFYSISFVDTESEGVTVNAGKIYTLTFKAIKDVTEDIQKAFTVSQISVMDTSWEQVSSASIGDAEIQITVVPSVEEETVEEIGVTSIVDLKDGKATVDVNTDDISKALNNVDENKKSAIVINPDTSNADKVAVELPKEAIESISEKSNVSLNIKTGVGEINIPNDALSEIVKAANGNISMNMESVAVDESVSEKLPEDAVTDNAVAVDFSIKSNENTISSFSGKSLEIAIPVNGENFEEGKKYTSYIISDNKVEASKAKIEQGNAVVSTTHFSKFVITTQEYIEPEKTFLTVSAPANVSNAENTVFTVNVYSTKWAEDDYKLLDGIIYIPEGLEVSYIKAGENLKGGQISWNADEQNKLRFVYNDANNLTTIEFNGAESPKILLSVDLKVTKDFALSSGTISIGGASLKCNSDSSDESSINVLSIPSEADEYGNTGSVTVKFNDPGAIAISAAELFIGDGIDIIPADKKGIAVSVTNLPKANAKITYSDGENTVDLYYSTEISAKKGVSCYLAIVGKDESIDNFADLTRYTVDAENEAEAILFGDTDGNGFVNAQDALNVINAWIRKKTIENDSDYLVYNVNCDSRINTYDALGIEEAFVNGTSYKIVEAASAK